LYGSAHPYNILARMVTPNLLRAAETTGKNQTAINQAVLACAVERFRLARGTLPEQLETLVPKFLDQVPSSGSRLEYRRTSDNQFSLVPVEESGKTAGRTSTTFLAARPKDASAVWQYPIKK